MNMGYDTLPTLEEIARMATWVDCPVHGCKVGVDSAGHVVGRCAECATEAAVAEVRLRAETLAREAA